MIVATAAGGWGAQGHRQVGAIADRLISQHPHASGQVRAILGNISLEKAAPWGDCVRSVTGPAGGYKYQPEERYRCPDFEAPALKAEMEDYVRNNWDNCGHEGGACHTQYHFLDLAVQRTQYRDGLVGTHKYDIVHAINAAVAVLGSPSCSSPTPAAAEIPVPGLFHFTCRQALMMLVHLVGDLHQPLHVASVYLDPAGRAVDPDSSQPERDRENTTSTQGGNALTWQGDDHKTHNLHSAWDDLSAQAVGARVAPTTGAIHTWAGNWATDTLRRSSPAFTSLSFSPKQGRSWGITFADKAGYDAARERLQSDQIERAGERLAQLIVAIWPDGRPKHPNGRIGKSRSAAKVRRSAQRS